MMDARGKTIVPRDGGLATINFSDVFVLEKWNERHGYSFSNTRTALSQVSVGESRAPAGARAGAGAGALR